MKVINFYNNYLMNNIEHDIGSKLKDFIVLKELGKGSYGVVNKVQSLRNHLIYVIKTLDLSIMKEKHRKDAWKEASILKNLNHVNIIKYYTSFLENESLHIVMEYAEGGDLYSVSPFNE